ncbi:Deleted in malignant brain tumors 1 protein [Saguinus oedipus]|uniref:Deleted in malignant brain tumors 1 protein n=1 Tax=Saguinus oedipus TaxID=9490 RepID=A0ABQ9UPV6_SAGOE|nr:Deleted in malignant brain tumors 1 protein [Saguinus oedipus]
MLWGHQDACFVLAANYSCGGFLNQPSGHFSSPFYPGNYPNNANCVWDIEVQSNYRVTVIFRDVQLEGGCNYDYIEVFDGPYHSSPLITRVCDGASGSFTSSSNFMSIRFISDHSITKRGFRAEYYSSPSNDSTSKSPCANALGGLSGGHCDDGLRPNTFGFYRKMN